MFSRAEKRGFFYLDEENPAFCAGKASKVLPTAQASGCE